jgi:galactonate dehydratase
MDLPERRLSLDIVRAVREAVGRDVQLMIEGHSRFSVAEAVWVGERLAEFEPTWFEEPTAHQNIASVVEVARKLTVPVATGESFSSPQQFAELLSHDAVHILQPEPGSMGGIWRTRQVAAMADAHYAVVAPHNAQGPISTATCVQIGAATPNLLVQEIFDEFNVDWEQDIVDHHAEVVDGRIHIPDRPGLGVDLNWAELEKHPYAITNFLPLFAQGWERREGERPPQAEPEVEKTGA